MSHISQVALRSPSGDRKDGAPSAGMERTGVGANFAPGARDKEKRELVVGSRAWKMEGSYGGRRIESVMKGTDLRQLLTARAYAMTCARLRGGGSMALCTSR